MNFVNHHKTFYYEPSKWNSSIVSTLKKKNKFHKIEKKNNENVVPRSKIG